MVMEYKIGTINKQIKQRETVPHFPVLPVLKTIKIHDIGVVYFVSECL